MYSGREKLARGSGELRRVGAHCQTPEQAQRHEQGGLGAEQPTGQRAQEPLTASAAIVIVVRPSRSARIPAAKLLRAPMLMATNAVRLAQAGSWPLARKLAARKIGSQVSMAKSSHMWPRYRG